MHVYENNQPRLRRSTVIELHQPKILGNHWLDRLVEYGRRGSWQIRIVVDVIMLCCNFYHLVRDNIASILLATLIAWWAVHHHNEHGLFATIFLLMVAAAFLIPIGYAFFVILRRITDGLRGNWAEAKYQRAEDSAEEFSEISEFWSIIFLSLLGTGTVLLCFFSGF